MKAIFLNTLFIISLLSSTISEKSFSADGYGDNEAKSKNDALKNLSELFSVKVNSSNKIQKKMSDDEFKIDIDTSLDVSSDITLPNVRYEVVSKKNNIFRTKAIVSQKDIVSYMENYKLLLESFNYKNDEQLDKTLKDIENIYKLFLVIDMEDKKGFIEFMKKSHKKFTSLLYDGVLIIPDGKKVSVYLNDEKINNKTFVESEQEHIIIAHKKGYFSIQQSVYLRSKENKTLSFEFIKNKKRNIRILSDTILINKTLKKYKIINSRNSKTSFKLSYKVKEKKKDNLVKILVDGKLILKIKKKEILIENSYNKTCRKQKKEKCLKIIKKQTAKQLIKLALQRIDSENK